MLSLHLNHKLWLFHLQSVHTTQLGSIQFLFIVKLIILEVHLEEQEDINLEGIFLLKLEIMDQLSQLEIKHIKKVTNKFCGSGMEKLVKSEVPIFSSF